MMPELDASEPILGVKLPLKSEVMKLLLSSGTLFQREMSKLSTLSIAKVDSISLHELNRLEDIYEY